MSALNTSSLCVTIVSVAPAGAPAKVVGMVRDGPNGVASDHYSRSTRSSPRTSNTEPLGASPYGDEDDPQLRVRIARIAMTTCTAAAAEPQQPAHVFVSP